MTRLSEILRQLAGSSPKRKFKPKPRTRRKSLEWKDGWDVFIPYAPVLFTQQQDVAIKRTPPLQGGAYAPGSPGGGGGAGTGKSPTGGK